ncbi:GtrA family protein [Erythrobacter sp. SCSIO 43205]|uniref:GtrA family protein n=1 Tax=Erythrobacter sp. SCSIO 43205 TaxID=2779361 RepID=UPI001CA7FBAD|nr:GtrA family protein [Erythrobacter sp. SCSIO 43205]
MAISRFLRFALVGAAGFVVDVAALYASFALGAGVYLGRVISYLCAATFTWGGNRRFTFASELPPSFGEWARFLIANASGGLVNYATYAALVSWGPGLLAQPALAVACGSIAGLVVNYLASSRFVFNQKV